MTPPAAAVWGIERVLDAELDPELVLDEPALAVVVAETTEVDVEDMA